MWALGFLAVLKEAGEGEGFRKPALLLASHQHRVRGHGLSIRAARLHELPQWGREQPHIGLDKGTVGFLVPCILPWPTTHEWTCCQRLCLGVHTCKLVEGRSGVRGRIEHGQYTAQVNLWQQHVCIGITVGGKGAGNFTANLMLQHTLRNDWLACSSCAAL